MRERFIRNETKNETKSNGELYLPDISVCNTNLQRGLKQNEYKYKMKAPLFLFSLALFLLWGSVYCFYDLALEISMFQVYSRFG